MSLAHRRHLDPVPYPLEQQTTEDFAEDVGDVEEALRGRMRATLEAATAVLQLVEDAAAKGAAGASDAGASGGGDGGLPSPGGGKGGGGRAGTNSKDAQLAALNNLLKAENNRLRDQALLDATKIKQLASSLAGAMPALALPWSLCFGMCAGMPWSAAARAGNGVPARPAHHDSRVSAVPVCLTLTLIHCCCADREDELLVAQRKITQLKAAAAGGAAGIPAGGAAAAAGGAGAGSPTPAAGAGAGAADGAGAERLHQLLQKRTAELEEREDALIKADRCAAALRGLGRKGCVPATAGSMWRRGDTLV